VGLEVITKENMEVLKDDVSYGKGNYFSHLQSREMLFYPKDRGSKLLRNCGAYLPDCVT